MDRSFVYLNTRKFMKRNAWNLFAAFLIVNIIRGLLAFFLTVSMSNSLGFFNSIFAGIATNTVTMVIFYRGFTAGVLSNFFLGTMIILLNSGLMFAIVRAFRNNWYFKKINVVKQLCHNTLNTFSACILIAIITSGLVFIPILGVFFATLFNFASYLLILTVQEEILNVVIGFKRCLEITKGSKLSLMLVQLRNLVSTALGLVLCYVLASFGGVLLFIGIPMGLVILTNLYPRVLVATSLYYSILNKKGDHKQYTA